MKALSRDFAALVLFITLVACQTGTSGEVDCKINGSPCQWCHIPHPISLYFMKPVGTVYKKGVRYNNFTAKIYEYYSNEFIADAYYHKSRQDGTMVVDTNFDSYFYYSLVENNGFRHRSSWAVSGPDWFKTNSTHTHPNGCVQVMSPGPTTDPETGITGVYGNNTQVNLPGDSIVTVMKNGQPVKGLKGWVVKLPENWLFETIADSYTNSSGEFRYCIPKGFDFRLGVDSGGYSFAGPAWTTNWTSDNSTVITLPNDTVFNIIKAGDPFKEQFTAVINEQVERLNPLDVYTDANGVATYNVPTATSTFYLWADGYNLGPVQNGRTYNVELPAPDLIFPANNQSYSVSGPVNVEFVVEDLSYASRHSFYYMFLYHNGQLYLHGGFDNPSITLASLPVGEWSWFVFGVDADGNQYTESIEASFSLVRNTRQAEIKTEVKGNEDISEDTSARLEKLAKELIPNPEVYAKLNKEAHKKLRSDVARSSDGNLKIRRAEKSTLGLEFAPEEYFSTDTPVIKDDYIE